VTPAERYLRSIWQFLKFGIVGGSGVLVNMAVNIVMNKLNGGTVNARNVLWAIPGTDFNVRFTHLAWIVPFLVANLWNFQLNRWWTFQSSKAANWWKEFWPFLAVGSVAAAAGLLLKILMENPVSPLYLPEPFFHEETGLTISVGAPCLVNEFHDPDGSFHQVDIFFRCTLAGGNPDGVWQDSEGVVTRRRWVTREELAGLRVKPDSLATVAWDEGAILYDPLEPIIW